MSKKIVSIQVIKPGSNPDVDSDFNTKAREHAVNHVKELHGAGNVASIGTFSTLAAKGSFKTMCTLYEIPFAQANKISDLIPSGGEGGDITIADIYDTRSDFYTASADFRSATAGEEWEKIMEGAKALEGRNKTTGVHPCGIVISSRPLLDTVPLQVRQDDGLVVTQWGYAELESLGLIKMDFLGLDTVDLIQHTIENIMVSGKVVPNMLDIINGSMDDKKTIDMIARGETIGLFQLAGEGVQDLLKRIKPTSVHDIIATTALYRPGPMGVQSHIRYADRKNGKEEVDFIHDDFKGTAIEEILGSTYGLVVYQEQIIRIANQIAGMTLQEGDDLRKAMGKKIMAKMLAMKPKFMEGGAAKGYSNEAMELLWNTCEEFAKYGFNLAHSVAYGINAYQTAYLKANYPVEFMAALIAQNVGNKNKVLTFLQEARRMGLKVGSVNVNISQSRVTPDFTRASGFDIVYGFDGLKGVSKDIAEIIITERDKNGEFVSVQDMINRCLPKGVANRRVYEAIAKAGGFDLFGVSRKAVVENLNGLLSASKTKEAKGASLFDIFGEADVMESSSIDLKGQEEFPHVVKLKLEADIVGLYLTGHPLEKAGPGLSKARTATIATLVKAQQMTTATLTVAITEIIKKPMRKGGKSVMVTLDDGTGYITANVSRELVKGMDKFTAQERIRKLYIDGETQIPEDMEEMALSSEFVALPDIEQNSVYVVSITFRPSRGESPYGARVNGIVPLALADDGSLPIRMRILYNDSTEEKAKELANKLPRAIASRNPGDFPIYLSLAPKSGSNAAEDESTYRAAIEEIRSADKKSDIAVAAADNTNLWGGADTRKKKVTVSTEGKRSWPPVTPARPKGPRPGVLLNEDEVIRNLIYVDTGYRAAKTKKTELDIEKYLGVESYDYGIFDSAVLED